MAYPKTNKIDIADTYFGNTINDPYRWLEDDRSAETKAWVEAENKVTQNYLNRIPFRPAIKSRLETLWNYEKYTAPFKEGDYTYFYKNDGLQNQYVLYRQKDKTKPEVFLDPNTFSKDATTSLAGIEFTKDGSMAAYQISEGGSDWRKVIILNTNDHTLIGDTLTDVKFSGLAWKGNEGFYYSSYDKPTEGSQLSGLTQFHKLYFHSIGSSQKEDRLIFGGGQTPRRYIGAGLTEDERFLVISAAESTTGNELYFQDLSKPGSPIINVVNNFKGDHSIIDNQGSKLYIFTNLNAPNYKVVTVDASNPGHENWKDLIPETDNVLSISTAGGKIFANYLKDATSLVMQYDMDGNLERTVTLPGVGSASGFYAKKSEKELYYTFTSYIYPPTIFKYIIANGQSIEYKKSGVKFDPSNFISKQVFYTSKDGTKIPMIITHKKGIELNGKNPTLLYGYGGFSVSLTPAFSTSNIIMLEQGGIYAVPNLRGGGEYGEKWHLAGTKMNKQNVFDDFIAAAEYLISNKYTSKDFLAVSGGSNGGLLVGAVMSQRPELFKVALPAVGVLDMLRYNKFTAGAGWAYDYGTAEDSKEMFEYLLKYSPYHALKPGISYPATLITTADHDDRVVPAHSFKFAARLQEYHKGASPALIRIETNAGHGAGKPTAKIIEEQADKWAFMLYNMGLTFN
ncbi:MAG TPA: prolyl oligopeptidase family serine peptidase [Daejeonella sp.]|uniref:prolyl oligopeptidase family serine peptidase n=1 Tax=Daejeonella sp. TaxID=2805397 RepID=UPI002C610F68|nr:prolyl oligopeptidase family serine peptidase [Daejeonella sp.]HQS05781.1 prolyl oligopeptidase family serine peptidase [Daejeonella sp.]HQS50980.1 prolyl oligopeptidase family serine peptidase [Daejeonella sp.]HQT21949.1 prolyl oligopeptidase family serine peptidase [Daejeonella sp.]HQT57256.1 prolyl oligopeptidase family serine peptidase [Daejeonella sp.]